MEPYTNTTMRSREELEQQLKEHFGLPCFYDDQWSTIERILKGERVLLIEKTGFGKSLCFQFPATLFDGTTIIFSPLIALMRDQVKKLNSLGIAAQCINSEQTPAENSKIIAEAIKGNVKILYIAPERQENSEWIEATRAMKLAMVVIDEAHCISVWGHDFRPAFRRIINLVKLLPTGLPVLATTATATKKVEMDVASQIGGNITVLRGNLLRENFQLYVVKVNSDEEKLIWLGKNLDKLKGTGVLYTGTRVETEIYTKWFDFLKLSTIGYHAGLDSDSRIEIEKGLMDNKWKCIISTNALGMGIDKSDIRFIIHTQIPQSPIHYYQEIGRAGRDGELAHIILFYNPKDKALPESFIEGGRPSIKKYEKVIQTIKNELLGEREIIKKINIKQNQFRVIKSDLIEQKIIREVTLNRSKKLEYITSAPILDVVSFETLRDAKKNELDQMIQYVETNGSRMKFLCDFLGDSTPYNFTNCDNTGLKKIKVMVTLEWEQKLEEYRENYFPVLNVEKKGSNIVNGIASSYYGVTNVGSSIHRCKYETREDFPDFLLKLVLKAFRKHYGNEHFDYILYIPPTVSGDLVKNFASKLSIILKIPISHDLIKIKQTEEQKIFVNSYLKADNVKGAFKILNHNFLNGKSVILFDDIFDSGVTFKEIGKLLTHYGVTKIAPLTIAKTVGGDL